MENPNRVIYGLVSSREPEHVRYVGQTRQLAKRTNTHQKSARRDTAPLYEWMRNDIESRYAITAIILASYAHDDALNEGEAFWIDKLRAEGHALFNMRAGGGYIPPTEESIAKARVTMMRLYAESPAVVEKIRASLREYYRDPDARAQLAETQRQRLSDPAARRAISESLKERYRSDPLQRARASAAGSKPKSEAGRRNISNGLRGHPVSSETRKKISDAQKGKSNRGSHNYWHARRGISKPEVCTFCAAAEET